MYYEDLSLCSHAVPSLSQRLWRGHASLDRLLYIDLLAPFSHIYNKLVARPKFAVGWLDEHHRFPTGSMPPHLVEHILELCRNPADATKGMHPCPFCDKGKKLMVVGSGDNAVVLGTAEVHVVGKGRVTYCAPTLIYHYIRDHAYLPPADFIAAIERSYQVQQSLQTQSTSSREP